MLISLFAAAPAGAATLSLSGGTLRYAAAPGETNTVTIAPDLGYVRVTEANPAVALTVRPGCSRDLAGTVSCPATSVARLSIDLGDGDDRVTSTVALPTTVNDGEGDDRVALGAGTDTLLAAPGADSLSGGGGTDTVDYAARTTPVSVSLDDRGGDGAGGERDDVRSDVENVTGGAGADHLVGSARDNVLRGNDGADTFDGGRGADTFIGNGGQDVADYSSRTGDLSLSDDGEADDGEDGEGDDIGADVDDLIGGAGDDVIVGSGWTNTLRGNGGRDELDGGDNDDVLDGGPGADTLAGGDGRDTVDYSSRGAAVTIDLGRTTGAGEAGEGDRVLDDVESATGGAGNDRLLGDGNTNVLSGGAGDDVLDGRGRNDTLWGGAGWDVADYSARSGGVSVSLDDGAGDGSSGEGDNARSDLEEIRGGSGDDKLTGDRDGNVLLGAGGADQLRGGDGADLLDGGEGNDKAWGGTGDDQLRLGRGTNEGDGEDGNDTLTADDGRDDLDGGAGADTLTAGAGDDALRSGDGDDSLDGGAGNDTVDGGRGNDHLAGATGADSLRGGDGDDALDGASGPDTLDGGSGADFLDAGDGNDKLLGQDGNDQLAAGDGADQLDGGRGDDGLDAATGDDRLAGGDGADALHGGDGEDSLDGGNGADALDGGADDDTVRGGNDEDGLDGGPGDDRVEGGNGEDRLLGSDGRDELRGGGGDDVLDGGAGPDQLSGDEGDDTADYGARTTGVDVSNDGRDDDGARGEGDDVGGSVERIIGGAGADDLRQTQNRPAILDGGAGDDTLTGDRADDELRGGPGNDKLTGGDGRDRLDAGTGGDTVAAVDGARDWIGCGDGRDKVTADKIDERSGCETTTYGTPKGATGGGKTTAAKPPAVSLPAGRITGTKVLKRGRRFVRVPGSSVKADRRLLADIKWLKAKYHIAITAGYALHGHEPHGEHPIGLGLDIVPGPGGSWADIDRLAKWAEPSQNHPRAPFRWVGYNGDPGHGRGNHLHLSWSHAPSKRGRPAAWVRVLAFRGGQPVRPAGASLRPLAYRPNAGKHPHVKTGLRAAPRCQGSGQLVPTWKAAAKAFGLKWSVLAAITEIESAFGCNMGPSSAGALGWTQFMPATWKRWGMDADGDGKASPYSSVDAIFSTARYLRASGAPKSYKRAIFAYNHAQWYVKSVLARTRKFR